MDENIFMLLLATAQPSVLHCASGILLWVAESCLCQHSVQYAVGLRQHTQQELYFTCVHFKFSYSFTISFLKPYSIDPTLILNPFWSKTDADLASLIRTQVGYFQKYSSTDSLPGVVSHMPDPDWPFGPSPGVLLWWQTLSHIQSHTSAGQPGRGWFFILLFIMKA